MLSIIVPSIRQHNIIRLIESIDYPDYELIIVGPYVKHDLSEYIIQNKLLGKIKIVTDYGQITRAIQIGLTLATGDFITIMCDDGFYHPNHLVNIISLLKESSNNTVVTCRYTEHHYNNHPIDYFLLKNAYQPSPSVVKNDWFITNFAFFYRSYLEYLGGIDCKYECGAFAVGADLAVRCYLENANIIFYDEPILHCDWEPQNPSHKAIEEAQGGPDTQYYIKKTFISKIPFDNWKNTDSIWSRRLNNYV